jgi:DNA-binding response OmpR family regulator
MEARIEALIRRSAISRSATTVKKGSIVFDILAGQTLLSGEDILLTQKEFAVLLLLAENEGKALSREYIYEKVWKAPLADDNQAIKKTVSRLRGKLAGSGYSIVSLRSEGYSFEPE